MAKIVQEVTRASREYNYEVAEAQTRDLDGIIQKLNTTYQQELKEELVLAIAEAAQNIVKHAFKNAAKPNELMVVEISCENKKLQIAFYDRGTPVDPKKVKHREIDNIKPGGLGTFFIQEIMDAVEFKDGKKPWINHLVLTKQL